MATPTRSSIQKAFVLGAGLGTRLKRLTESRPKPLIPLCGKPLITYAFDHVLGAGVKELIVNTHHRAEAYGQFFPDGQYCQTPIHFRHEPVLLETGGGLKNIGDLVGNAPLLVYNGDVLSTLPLAPAIEYHLRHDNEVTLIVRSQGGPLHIALEVTGGSSHPTGHVTDIRQSVRNLPGTHLFTGIYLVSPRFLQRLDGTPRSVTPCFVEMIREGNPPNVIVIDEGLWWDLGTREQILAAHRHHLGHSPWIAPTAKVAPNARITGASAIGPDCVVEGGAWLHDTILWNGVTIRAGSQLTRCIVTDHQTVSGNRIDRDF